MVDASRAGALKRGQSWASVHRVEDGKYVVQNHKTEAAARKATYKYGQRVGVVDLRASGDPQAGDKAKKPVKLKYDSWISPIPQGIEEGAALESYYEGGYLTMNPALRGHTELSDVDKSKVQILDALITRDAKPATQPVLLYRAVQIDEHKFTVGETVHEGAYMSTSASGKGAGQYGETHKFQITVPEGTPLYGMPLQGGAGGDMEHPSEEIVLPRGAQLRIDEVRGKTVKATLVGFKPDDLDAIPAAKPLGVAQDPIVRKAGKFADGDVWWAPNPQSLKMLAGDHPRKEGEGDEEYMARMATAELGRGFSQLQNNALMMWLALRLGRTPTEPEARELERKVRAEGKAALR